MSTELVDVTSLRLCFDSRPGVQDARRWHGATDTIWLNGLLYQPAQRQGEWRETPSSGIAPLESTVGIPRVTEHVYGLIPMAF